MRHDRPRTGDRGHLSAVRILLPITACLFGQGALNATTIAICWPVVLFFASAARPLTAPDAAAAPHGRRTH